MSVNMTKTRIAVLRLIQQRPGIARNSLAILLYEGGHIMWSGYHIDDAPTCFRGPSGQSSARWSGNYISPLIEAGLVKKRIKMRFDFPVDVLTLTDKGREELQNG